MAALKNIIIHALFATAVLAAPTELEESSSSTLLVARKKPNKCEAHIHIDTSNGLCGSHCTDKYHIDLLDNQQPAQPMGYDFNWKNVGTWAATNPNYQIKIKTTKGPELWIDGSIPRTVNDKWRSSFTLHYGSQHWNSHECPTWNHKGPRPSNGHRHEFDLWCEFDC